MERTDSVWNVIMVGTWMLCGTDEIWLDVIMVGTWMLCGNGRTLSGRYHGAGGAIGAAGAIGAGGATGAVGAGGAGGAGGAIGAIGAGGVIGAGGAIGAVGAIGTSGAGGASAQRRICVAPAHRRIGAGVRCYTHCPHTRGKGKRYDFFSALNMRNRLCNLLEYPTVDCGEAILL